MNTYRSAGAEVINLDAVRTARRAKRPEIRSGLLHDVRPSKDTTYTRELADSISLQEGYDIARSIVNKFSAKGSLLQAFIDRRKRESRDQNEEFHVVIMGQRKMVALYSTDDLKALLALYAKRPSHYYETYVVPAAEEYLSRFQQNVEEA